MKKFKMPDSFTILFIIIIIVGFMTWFIPSGEYRSICQNTQETVILSDGSEICPNDQASADMIYQQVATDQEIDESLYNQNFDYQYQEIDQEKQGIWQILSAPINGFYDAVDIALFVLVVGGFLNVVMITGSLDAGILSLLKKFKNKENYLIPILMTLFAIGGSTFGMCEEAIVFYALIVPVFIIAGYDAIVGVMIILLGAGVGVLASTVNPFAIGVASQAANVGIGDGIISRFILWVIVLVLAIIFTLMYANKVKKDPTKSIVYDIHHEKNMKQQHQKEEQQIELTTARKLILSLFTMTFVIMVLSVIPWEDFNIYLFSNINDYFNENLVIISGNDGLVALGNWWFGELTTLFFTFAIIIGIVAKKSGLLEDDFVEVFVSGCKDLLTVALIIGLSRGISVIMANSGMDATFLYYGSTALEQLGAIFYAIGVFIFYLPMSFLIPSSSGLAGATIPVLGPLGELIYDDPQGAIITITAFSAASGIVNLVTPTSGVIIGGLAIADVPYSRWVKHVLPFMIVLSIVVIIFLVILSLIVI